MPLYHYICNECDKDFEIRHSYGAKDVVCFYCGSDSIQRNLGNRINISIKRSDKPAKVGHEVNKAIEEGRADLEKTKKALSKERKKDE
jgi:putative FmdB family regulatory protein